MAVPISTMATKTFEGLSAGINQALPAHEIPDNAAVWMQDIILNIPGIVRMRGPLQQTADITASITSPPQGAHQATIQDGTVRMAFLAGRGTPRLNFISPDNTSTNNLTWPGSWAVKDPVFDSKPALGGGTFIGASDSFLSAGTAGLVLWRGGSKGKYSTGTISSTRGSKTITGSGTAWSGTAEAGQFIIANDGAGTFTLLGTIASVDTSTSITLVEPALATVAASAYQIQNARGIVPRCIKGRATIATTTTTVIGAGTKFNMMNDGNTWQLFRQSDMAYIGQVSSITNDTALNLTANAAVALSNDHFVGIRVTGATIYDGFELTNNTFPGFLTAVYQNRQFYANLPYQSAGQTYSNRVWFSDENDPEGLDMSPDDGDFFDVTSQSGSNTPILAIAGLQNALAILKEDELYALTGSDPTQFQLRKIADIGTISPMSVQVWRNVVIFASRQGVFSFDGVSLTELSAELGPYWRDAMRIFSSETGRAYSLIYRNHYLLYLTEFDSSYGTTENTITTAITAGTWMVSLDSGAWTFLTNSCFKGAITLPPATGKGAYFVVENNAVGTNFIDAETFWSGTGQDSVVCSGWAAGPDFYIETKKYTVADPELKKNWKQLNMTYKLIGDTLSMETIPGLTSTGTLISKAWPQQLDYTNTKRKFQKRSTHISFRLYETLNTAIEVEIGPWMIGFKPLRPGRV